MFSKVYTYDRNGNAIDITEETTQLMSVGMSLSEAVDVIVAAYAID